ncbi:MAG: glycosyltransferase family 1 protein [Candidatus Lokiarchaeota archaeon]|nr:glycosyltransferase family 1 protein [Candidatus Lokiarchaeota archaeon]
MTNVQLIVQYSNTRPFGGPQAVAYDTIEGFKKKHDVLSKKDLTISVLSLINSKASSSTLDPMIYPNINIQNIREIKPSSLTNDLHFTINLIKKRSDIDLIHSHISAAAFAATWLGIPTIFSLHGMFWKEQQFARKWYYKFPYILNTLRLKYALRKVKRLIAISPYVIDEFRENIAYPATNIELIENPVSDFFFNVKKNEFEGLIFSPGAITPRKNQIEQVKAMNVIKKAGYDCKLILTGKISDRAYFIQLKKSIKDFNLDNNIFILGEVSFDELLRYYSEACVVTLSSKQETAPMVISEGMATGTPIIAPDICGVPYMITDNNDGFLINPTDYTNIAEKLIILLDDKKLREKIGKNAHNIAVERWKSELIVQKLIDLYLVCDG